MPSKFKQLKLNWLILAKYLSRHKKRVLAYSLITVVVIFGLLQLIPYLSKARPITEGVVGTYQEHDIPEVVINLISSPLVKTDAQGKIVPNLVKGWDVNEDATAFRFTLNDNLTWVDGTPINSNDISFNIPDVEFTYPDPKTIEFKLKGSYSPFPSLLTKPILKKGTLIGTGPYQISKVEKSRIFITKLVLTPKSQDLPSLNVRFYPNEKIALTAYNLGEIQALLGVSDQSIVNQNPNSAVFQKTTYDKVVAILYNTKDPLLSNRSLRQALSYSAPEIKSEVVAKTPFPPYSWAFTDQVNDYLSNTEAAKAALKRAKSSSSEEMLENEMILTTIPQYESLGKQIVDAWKELGVNAILRVESGIPQNFQALLAAQSIPDDPDQYSLWHSTQTKTNITGFDSKRVDKDLEDGRKLQRVDDRIKSYADFQKELLEESPATFMYFPKYNVLYLKKIEHGLNRILPIQIP